MPASEWYKRQKDKVRRALRAQNSSSVSLPNSSQARPPSSPAPQVVTNPTNEGLGNISRSLASTKNAETSNIIPNQLPVGNDGTAPSAKSLPNPDVGHLHSLTSDETTAAAPSPPLNNTPDAEEKTKKINWSGLKALLGVLKSGTGGIGPLDSAIGGLERCVGIFEQASKARDDYQEQGDKLDQLLGDLAQFNSTWMGKAMTASVKNLCGGIEAELSIVEEKQGGKEPGRYMETMEDSDAILECYRRIQGHVERLLLNANLNMWKTLDEEMTDRRLLRLSPTMSGAYNSWAADRTRRRQCMEGTRVPELEKLKDWVRNPSTEPIYRINGMAGTGKTTIAYTLCAQLDTTNELAASFFCTRLIPECRSVQLIIPAIAYQLAQFSYPFRHELSKALGSDQMAHTRELETQFRTLITSPLKEIRRTLPSRLVVVIDALDDPSTEPIYWINGMAGTGKTTIAYTLCAQLETTNELAASFFCTRLIPECRSVQLIIPAIAYQLAQFSYPFRHELSKALGSDQMAHTRELETQFRTFITSPLKEIRRTLPSRLVVILELLVTSASDLPIRFLVSSRPEPEIYRCMMKQVGGNSDARLVLHELDPHDVQQDIEAYLREELQDLPLTTNQWRGLVEHCGVLFIYASTVCRYIKIGGEMMSYEAVEIVLGLSLAETGDMEKGLDSLYTAILEAAFNRPQIEPMTTEMLAGLLGLKNAEHASTLLRPLLSVVNLTEDTGAATIWHASFLDFMLSPNRSADFFCAAATHHITLTHACLQQIRSNPVQFNICGIESSYLLDDEIKDLPQRADRAVSPALFYASCHWIAHLEAGGHSIDLPEPVFDFLSTRLLLWMEVLNVTRRLYFGSTGIVRLEKWCREALMSKEAVELANDAREFVQIYHDEPVHQSTAHIYISMLPFWPSDGPIAKHYASRIIRMPQPEGTAITRRRLPLLATRNMGGIRSASFSSDGSSIVTGAHDGSIWLWSTLGGEPVMGPLTGHEGYICSVAISSDGAYIASASSDKTIRLWDIKGGKGTYKVLEHHTKRADSLGLFPANPTAKS
ncbi:hypothetical protein RSAG8_07355, partial [Rhizoctonia solani AG-8 WAC10335]